MSTQLHEMLRTERRNTKEADRARRLMLKALALEAVQDATDTVEAALKEQNKAMEYAHSVRCSLRDIGEAANMSFSGVNSRLKKIGVGSERAPSDER